MNSTPLKLHSQTPYWLTPDGVVKIEKLKEARYMGPWCTKRPSGYSVTSPVDVTFSWNESPVDIFYVENPDISKGHSHYFGIFYRDDTLFITNGESAFSEPIYGKLTENNEVVVSRFRHDYIEHGGVMVDGGRDYFKTGTDGKVVLVTVKGPDFYFEVQE